METSYLSGEWNTASNRGRSEPNVSVMELLWFTGRSMSDLCSCTQRALIDGLLQNDVRITYVNSDASVDIKDKAFTHVGLTHRARLGLKARTLGKLMAFWLSSTM